MRAVGGMSDWLSLILRRDEEAAMTMVLTEVSATVPSDRVGELTEGFAALTRQALPDGLLRTELLGGTDGEWRIQSLWRDQAALDAMRAQPDPPAAPKLFREVGAEPALKFYVVNATHAVARGR